MGNPITDLQTDIEGILAADATWASIPILTEKIDDLENKIDDHVNRINGIATLIVSPIARVPRSRQNQPGPYFDPVSLVVRTFEKPILNTTGLRCLDVTLQACALLHLHSPESAVIETLVCDGYQLGKDPKWFCYDALFSTRGGVKSGITKLPDVTATLIGSNLTLRCLQAGAAIFYTADGSNPSPHNGALYTSPFAVSSGITVKARAWLAGFLPSDRFEQQF